ncbi:unnamed protein product [Linum trigynum]|uniref:Uncharacterized protein n=1 Tax=Linum trigynum TaxID=586398 RepID=A0AAV2E5D3_9ROSI
MSSSLGALLRSCSAFGVACYEQLHASEGILWLGCSAFGVACYEQPFLGRYFMDSLCLWGGVLGAISCLGPTFSLPLHPPPLARMLPPKAEGEHPKYAGVVNDIALS